MQFKPQVVQDNNRWQELISKQVRLINKLTTLRHNLMIQWHNRHKPTLQSKLKQLEKQMLPLTVVVEVQVEVEESLVA